MWRDGNPSVLLMGMQTGVATMENSMEVPQKVKHRTNYIMIQQSHYQVFTQRIQEH